MDKNFDVYFKDIIVAYVPREKFSYPNGKTIENGKINELAIINRIGTRFILIDEFETKNIRPIADHFLQDSASHLFIIDTPNIVTTPQNPINKNALFKKFNLVVTPEEKKAGKISFQKLEKLNDEIIKIQLDTALENFYQDQKQIKKLRAEKAERAIYNNF